jgi:hypothetical protein
MVSSPREAGTMRFGLLFRFHERSLQLAGFIAAGLPSPATGSQAGGKSLKPAAGAMGP